MKTLTSAFVVVLVLAGPASDCHAEERASLTLHAIFDGDMVLQRGKPITIWGWATPGQKVAVQLGSDRAEAEATGEKGRWEVTFPAREASAEPQTLTVTAGTEKIELGNIVVGDVWVMYGQSNMAFPLGKVLRNDTESLQANLPNLRLFSITTNEQADLPDDIDRTTIDP
jgi:sialate O-acetylesterase